jgi:histone H3/H4
MDAGAHKLLETIILKTLHAHSFTRSSTQASLALTDLLSQYLVLLATTCSQYAQHAGRLNITVRDAMSALDELGVSMDELHEYCGTEGDELERYSGHCAKRQEDLSEFKGQSERDDCHIFSVLTPSLLLAVQRRWQPDYLSSVNQYR